MSFDLYAFPASGPRTVAEVQELLEAAEAMDRETDPTEPDPALRLFVDELERRWPSLETDPDASPWASWPLWQPEAWGGLGLNISWSRAEDMFPAVLELAQQLNVAIYDPQDDRLYSPAKSGAFRRLFRR